MNKKNKAMAKRLLQVRKDSREESMHMSAEEKLAQVIRNTRHLKKMNILNKTRIYLIGSIEDASDSGSGWRKHVTEEFSKIGIRALDPCNKPFKKDIDETDTFQKEMKQFRENGQWDELSERMKEIRIYDLKLVDISDAVFVYLDADVKTCGSWEELFWANRLKKPIFFVYKQGKQNVPTWMFGTLHHKYFYDSIEDALDTIKKINSGEKTLDSDRWKLLREEYR